MTLDLTTEQLFASTMAVAAAFRALTDKLGEADVLDVDELRDTIVGTSLGDGFSDEAVMMFNAIGALLTGQDYEPPKPGEKPYPSWFRGIYEGSREPDGGE